MASLENEHDSFREVHLSLVYVWSDISWYFIHSFTSYSCLSGSTFAFVLYYHNNAPQTRPWKRWPNWTNYDSIVINWLFTHRILQTWPLATIICSQTSAVAPGKEIHIEWGSHRGNRGVFRRLGRFVLQKGHRNIGKSLYQMYRPRRQLSTIIEE